MKHRLILLSLLSMTVFSVQSQSLEQALKECKAITDSDLKRLICYDAIEVAALKPAKTEKKIKQQQVAKPSVVKPKQEAQFGLRKKVENKEPELITATVSKVKKAAYGKLTIYLENGQVWKQSDSTSISLKVDDTIVIKERMFNSYILKKQGSNRVIKVKRIK